ncbi:phycocyanobilin ferredoxin oxidoreductase-like protein [Scenedesmus sp. NREL 46B-D3]|nr:phycocyanobilin ferredoxin oxidoreductase-like protein [Scenedesmus sp. NREL 46B-D3]
MQSLTGPPTAPAADTADQQQQVDAFSEDELRGLSAVDSSLGDEALGEAWRSVFEDDLDGLYDYVDRDQLQYADRIRELKGTPKHLWEQIGILDKMQSYPPGLVADMMGMGTWRLNGTVDEVFSFLVGRLESSMRELLDTDLALYPADKWKQQGWDFIDSLDPQKEWEGFSYVDMPDPLKGMEGYPRLLIENRVYSSRVFRKLHLEVAHRQDGLQVLHMVLFPRYDFDIPILALDLVAAGGAVTLAIIDACPVTSRLSLPQHYVQTMTELQQNFLPESCQARNIPEWGGKIFSPLCVCMRPDTPEELGGFMKYAIALTRAHLMYSQLLEPLRPTDKPSARRLSELLACHERFCEQQLANTKTARVLEVAFDPEFTQAYMSKLMFDYSPREDVPWFDGSLAHLYEYFEQTPELWTNAAEFMKTRMKLDEKKASDYLRRFLAGDPSIKLPRLSFALQHMYDYDEDFQSAVDRSLAEKDPDELPDVESMGEYLAEQLSQLVYGQSAAQHAQDVEAAAAQERQRQLEAVAAAPAFGKEGKDADKNDGDGDDKDKKKLKLPWQK